MGNEGKKEPMTVDDFIEGYCEGMRGHEVMSDLWHFIPKDKKAQLLIYWAECYLDDVQPEIESIDKDSNNYLAQQLRCSREALELAKKVLET